MAEKKVSTLNAKVGTLGYKLEVLYNTLFNSLLVEYFSGIGSCIMEQLKSIGQLEIIQVQNLSQRDSSSLSPRVTVNSTSEHFKKTYQFKEQPAIHRFLIDDIQTALEDEMELKVFRQATNFLTSTPSAEDILKKTPIPPRQIRESNSVLVDIIDKKNPGFHTICLWKKTNQNFLIIDPSSYEYSSRLNKLLSSLSLTFEVTVKKYIDNVSSIFKDLTERTID